MARMAALLAGLPDSVPGATVNRLCASGLEAVNAAARAVKLGEGDYYLAGGVESMSRAPWVVGKPERGLPRGEQTMHDTTLGWRFVNPRMAELGVSTESMGETGENVAERYGVEPRGPGRLRPAQPPARGRRRRGRAASPRRSSRSRLQRGGKRSSSTPTRGPGRTPRWRRWRRCGRSSARAARSPPATPRPSTTAPPACWSPPRRGSNGSAPSPWPESSPAASPASTPPTWASARSTAIPRALAAAGLDLDQIDLIELNEAFASQVLACARELGIDEDRLNVNGGAIALGHPLGCSGARLATTLVRELRRRDGRYGIATMCVGVGQGLATVFEAV